MEIDMKANPEILVRISPIARPESGYVTRLCDFMISERETIDPDVGCGLIELARGERASVEYGGGVRHLFLITRVES